MGLTSSTVTRAPDDLFQMTQYNPCGTHYWNKAFSLNACAVDQFYFTKLV